MLVSPTPASAGHNLAPDIEHEVRVVVDERRIDVRDVLHARGGLPLIVERRKVGARGRLHEGVDRILVVVGRRTEAPFDLVHPFSHGSHASERDPPLANR